MNYSISDLERLTGISVHNIRVWERRYNALQPSRSVGNTRYYDDSQLKRLLNIAGLYFSGHKISKACAMSKEETESFLQQEINATVSSENQYEYFIARIISRALSYEEYEVSQLITKSLERHGILNTYKFVMYPLLVRVGLMWRQDSLCPSQEHFLSSVFRQKLYTAIDSCPAPKPGSQKWLLFLPEDEDHEIGLLLANYLLRASGKTGDLSWLESASACAGKHYSFNKAGKVAFFHDSGPSCDRCTKIPDRNNRHFSLPTNLCFR